MSLIKMNSITLGDGKPKICISNTGKNKAEIIEQTVEIAKSPAQIMEWRVDCLDSEYSEKCITEILSDIRKAALDMPILFTFRSKEEGGEKYADDDTYFMLNQTAIKSGMVQMVDVELGRGDDVISRIKDLSRQYSIVCLMSYHNFNTTPDEEALLNIVKDMQDHGADICKLAVMPDTDKDVLQILELTEKLKKKCKVPYIIISMGEKGKISRVYAGRLGSVLTFASLGQASAPGQIEVSDMEKFLQILY